MCLKSSGLKDYISLRLSFLNALTVAHNQVFFVGFFVNPVKSTNNFSSKIKKNLSLLRCLISLLPLIFLLFLRGPGGRGPWPGPNANSVSLNLYTFTLNTNVASDW